MTSDNLIAFSDNGIWVAEPDGGNRRRLAGRGEGPAWSPDGSRILYIVDHDEKRGNRSGHEAWVVSADGSGRYRLAGDFTGSSWSPDGHRIAYVTRKKNLREANTGQLYIAEADGSQRRYVSETLYYKVRWAPDGRRISYMKPVPGGEGGMSRHEIWMARADGSEPRRLSPDGSDLRWSPNGDRVVYNSYFFNNADVRIRVDLWVEEANGGGRMSLVQCVSDPPPARRPSLAEVADTGRLVAGWGARRLHVHGGRRFVGPGQQRGLDGKGGWRRTPKTRGWRIPGMVAGRGKGPVLEVRRKRRRRRGTRGRIVGSGHRGGRPAPPSLPTSRLSRRGARPLDPHATRAGRHASGLRSSPRGFRPGPANGNVDGGDGGRRQAPPDRTRLPLYVSPVRMVPGRPIFHLRQRPARRTGPRNRRTGMGSRSRRLPPDYAVRPLPPNQLAPPPQK